VTSTSPGSYSPCWAFQIEQLWAAITHRNQRVQQLSVQATRISCAQTNPASASTRVHSITVPTETDNAGLIRTASQMHAAKHRQHTLAAAQLQLQCCAATQYGQCRLATTLDTACSQQSHKPRLRHNITLTTDTCLTGRTLVHSCTANVPALCIATARQQIPKAQGRCHCSHTITQFFQKPCQALNTQQVALLS
jgi:hypothetical protein